MKDLKWETGLVISSLAGSDEVKSVRRYWIDSNQILETSVLIQGDSFHHIIDVCRLSVGDVFEVLDGNGLARLVRLQQLEKKKAVAEILEVRPIKPLEKPWIYLAVSLPRYATFEVILEKAVELGVHSVHPFVSDHSFIRTPQSLPEGKVVRWEKIVRGATQQTGRGDLMKIAPLLKLEEIWEQFNQLPSQLGLFPFEGQGELTLRQALKEDPETHKKPEGVWLFVGSEGGYSMQEVNDFQRKGFRPVTLGDQVLRVETACLAMVSIIKYEFDLMR